MITYPISDERRFDSSHQRVDDHTDRKEEANGIAVDASNRSVDGRSTHQKVDSGDYLVDQRVRGEDKMDRLSVADFDDLKVSLGVRGLPLEFHSCDRE